MNKMKLTVLSTAKNVSFVRSTVCAFATCLNPTMEVLDDIKTAVSEAVTNCVVHAYQGGEGYIDVEAVIEDKEITITVSDTGIGIENPEQAFEAYFTTKEEDGRSGLGFTLMRAFMDFVELKSEKGIGTKVTMKKTLSLENG